MKTFSYFLTGIGLFIVVTIAIIAIIDSEATDLISAIPSSILGASLFISGYLGIILIKERE